MNEEADRERERIIKSYKRPTIEDAVRLSKMLKIDNPRYMFELLSDLLSKWVDHRDMTGTWE